MMCCYYLLQNVWISLYIKSTDLKHDEEIVYGHLHVCPSVRPSVRLSVRPYVCPSVRPSICLSFENILPMAIKFCNNGLPNNLSVGYQPNENRPSKTSLLHYAQIKLIFGNYFLYLQKLVQQLTMNFTYLLLRKDNTRAHSEFHITFIKSSQWTSWTFYEEIMTKVRSEIHIPLWRD